MKTPASFKSKTYYHCIIDLVIVMFVLLPLFVVACSEKGDIEPEPFNPVEKVDTVIYDVLVTSLDNIAATFTDNDADKDIINKLSQVKGVKMVEEDAQGVLWVTSHTGDLWFYAPKGTTSPGGDVSEEDAQSIIAGLDESLRSLMLDDLLAEGELDTDFSEINYEDFEEDDDNATRAVPRSELYLQHRPQFKLLYVNNAPDANDGGLMQSLCKRLKSSYRFFDYKIAHKDSISPNLFSSFAEYDMVILANHGARIGLNHEFVMSRNSEWEKLINSKSIYGYISSSGTSLVVKQETFDKILPDMSNSMFCDVMCYGADTGFYKSLMKKSCPIIIGSYQVVTMPMFHSLMTSFLPNMFLGGSAVSAWNKEKTLTFSPKSYDNTFYSQYDKFTIGMSGNGIQKQTMICKPLVSAFNINGKVDVNDPVISFRVLAPEYFVSKILDNSYTVGYQLKDLTENKSYYKKVLLANSEIKTQKSIGDADAVNLDMEAAISAPLVKGHKYNLRPIMMGYNKGIVYSPYMYSFTAVDNLNHFDMTFKIPTNNNNCYLRFGRKVPEPNYGENMEITSVEVDGKRTLITGIHDINIPPGKHTVTVNHTGKLLWFPVVGDTWNCFGQYTGSLENAQPYIISVNIPASVKWLGGFGWSTLENITLHDGLLSIDNQAFTGCKSLHTINLPSSITDIGSYAFAESGLYTLRIPDGASIGAYVFTDCKSLGTLILPSNIETVYAQDLVGCTHLEALFLLASYPPGLRTEQIEYAPRPTVYVPLASVEAYQNSIWGQYFSIAAIP